MRILALDLAKNKTVGCDFDSELGEHSFATVQTTPEGLHDLIVERSPDRVVFEICSAAGWVHDLASALDVVEVQVADPSGEGWSWRRVKRKNDRVDALKLARLSALNQLPTVHVPSEDVRHWRSFINYRSQLVRNRTQIKNQIRSLLEHVGLRMPPGTSSWCAKRLDALGQLTMRSDFDPLWRQQLRLQMKALEHVEGLIHDAEMTLAEFAKSNRHVKLLQTIPGVGPRVAEAVVAVIDDPHRFKSGKQVGSYVGLTPRQYQSGLMNRQGGISCRGHRLLRTLLVQAAWLGLRYNPWMRAVYQRVLRGSPSRKKIAIVAVARRLMVRCWVLMKCGRSWEEAAILRVA
jgi:transposase